MQQTAFHRLLRLWLLCVPFAVLFSSCTTGRYYRQNIMFRTPSGEGVDTMKLRSLVGRTSRNYLIQPNDYLEVRVYTNKGERILDPNGELQFGSPSTTGTSTTTPTTTTGRGAVGGNRGGQTQQPTGANQFLVQANGMVNLPMVNMVKVNGLTLLEADSLLKTKYDVFYKDSYVATRVTNNRIIVLGAPGGQIVPMYNDNMNLLEVLASAGGLEAGGFAGGGGAGGGRGRAYNIRLIRGDLRNPQVQVIDLSTIEGMRRANLQVEPNDVVYIEPVRRPFFEALSDAGSVFGLIGGLAGILTSYVLVRDLINK
ncbi:polysaccharide biosynthesis/export family protein [Hymenobacter chitinivorans]|uniref:Polysaccharide export outer membrane protein n=1 Tax=Hymenobacter chitinivorans DSM 11115 TaxID=1121954 RepID=A0A2M9B9H6_9BACT|nr:polysaccharide biosynthesis/export family protein [Hymenobacter chitinivorans]PJJ54576.1 polysaccharide export outer membrane protein [Hymenobacter chitinivorans DSM 11115]